MSMMRPGGNSLQQFMKQQQDTWARTRQQGAWKQQRDRQRRRDRQRWDAAQRQAWEPFRRAEAQARQLTTAHATGRLSDDEYSAGLKRLMVQDDTGTWWAVGRSSGQWYRHDGARWTAGNPAAARPVSPPVDSPPRPHPLRGLLTLIAFLAITYLAVVLTASTAGGYAPAVTAAVGLLVTLLAVRRAWRSR